jgi:propanediol dehydratase large subunit
MRLLVLCVTLCICSCNIFEKDEKILAMHKLKNGREIKIVSVALGATTADVVQVRVADPNNTNEKEELLKVYENYHFLSSSAIIRDTLQVCLSNDTNDYNFPPDTFYLDLSKVINAPKVKE